ncbi:MAG: hypothetical protein PHX14_10020 [Syntrophomonadaceae bacterium]|nr:hypothetical protein [Syntrophomonadaceae bacterium]
MSEYQRVIYICLSFCRVYNKLLSQIDNETVEDTFDLLIVANLTDTETGGISRIKKGYIDQVGI